jgi:hypothetical protein
MAVDINPAFLDPCQACQAALIAPLQRTIVRHLSRCGGIEPGIVRRVVAMAETS